MLFIIRDSVRRDNCLSYIRSINFEAKPIQVDIKPYRKNRSSAQNRTMWAWLHVLSEHTGYDAEELHELFKARFLGVEAREVMGQQVFITKSTAKLTTQQFAEYMNKIEAVAAEMGVRLPIPDDYAYAMHHDSKGENHGRIGQ